MQYFWWQFGHPGKWTPRLAPEKPEGLLHDEAKGHRSTIQEVVDGVSLTHCIKAFPAPKDPPSQ